MLLLLFIQSEERSIARTCRSALARDAPARRTGTSEQELSSACGSRVTFSLRGHARAGARANGEAGPKGGGQDARSKEKDNQREKPPRLALVGHPAQQVREPGPGFSTGHPALAKRSRHPCRLPLRGLSSPSHRRTGAPGKAAGHPGPHFSEQQKLKSEAKAKAKAGQQHEHGSAAPAPSPPTGERVGVRGKLLIWLL